MSLEKNFTVKKSDLDKIQKGDIGDIVISLIKLLGKQSNIKIDSVGGPYKHDNGDQLFLIRVNNQKDK